MRTAIKALVVVLLAVCAGARAAEPAGPAVVELYQSQGCSSCPPANLNLNGAERRFALAPSPDPALRTAILVQTRGGPIIAAGVR